MKKGLFITTFSVFTLSLAFFNPFDSDARTYFDGTKRSFSKVVRIRTPRPAPIPTPMVTSKTTPKPAPTQPAPTTDAQTQIMHQINSYRASQGLGPVSTNAQTCNFAATRAQEISTNFSHDGFRDRINNKTLPYSSYSSITENIAMTSNPQEVVGMWIASAGHAANMRKDTPYVCVAQYGNYYAYEGWKP